MKAHTTSTSCGRRCAGASQIQCVNVMRRWVSLACGCLDVRTLAHLHEVLSSSFARETGIFDIGRIRRDVGRHQTGKVDLGREIFDVLQYLLWAQSVGSGSAQLARCETSSRPMSPNRTLRAPLLVALVAIAWPVFRFWGLGGAPLAVDEYFLGTSILNTAARGLPEFACGGFYTRGVLTQYLSVPLLWLGQSVEFTVRFWRHWQVH